MSEKFVLCHTNSYNERHYFVKSGDWHQSRKIGLVHLVEKTSDNIDEAKRFYTAPEAANVLAESGNQDGWTIVPIVSS